MARVENINFNDFMSGGWKEPKASGAKQYFTQCAIVAALVMPETVAAEDGGAFDNLHDTIMSGMDKGVVLVIIFAGAAWGLGHRSKAIEILLGVCCGYVLARHAKDIRNILKGI